MHLIVNPISRKSIPNSRRLQPLVEHFNEGNFQPSALSFAAFLYHSIKERGESKCFGLILEIIVIQGVSLNTQNAEYVVPLTFRDLPTL